MNATQFTNKFGPWAVVTGASSGIGSGYAQELTARGLNVVLIARNDVRLKELADELEQAHSVDPTQCLVGSCLVKPVGT